MLWRFVPVIVGIAVLAILLFLSGPSTRDRILAGGPGPVDADAPQDFATTDSGLRYRILRDSFGRSPQPTDTVTVHYAGWLDDGTQFDSTYGSRPYTTALAHVVPGWKEGLPLVSEGGMIELEIPSELGFGTHRSGRVPPNSTLHYILELLKVEAADEAPGAGPRDPDAPDEFITIESGLKYRVLRKSEGRHPRRNDIVRVHYKGWLDSGAVFDNSWERGLPSHLRVDDEIIAGWREGLTYVGEGGMIELEIPSELGYGAEGASKVPPHSTLHFILELVAIE